MLKNNSLFDALLKNGYKSKSRYSYEMYKTGIDVFLLLSTPIPTSASYLYAADCKDELAVQEFISDFNKEKSIASDIIVMVFCKSRFVTALCTDNECQEIMRYLGKKINISNSFKLGKVSVYIEKTYNGIKLHNHKREVFEVLNSENYKEKIDGLAKEFRVLDAFLMNLQYKLLDEDDEFRVHSNSLIINKENYYYIIRGSAQRKYDLTFYRVYGNLNKLESVSLTEMMRYIEKMSYEYDKTEKLASFFR